MVAVMEVAAPTATTTTATATTVTVAPTLTTTTLLVAMEEILLCKQDHSLKKTGKTAVH